MDSKLVDIAVQVKYETKAAYLINDGDKDIWIPKSQCELHFEPNKSAILTLPEWLALDKELI